MLSLHDALPILGVVVERLGGLDLERCFQERIFDPLGMPDTFFELPEDRVERMTDAWQWGPDGTLSLYDRGARSGWRRPLRLRSGGGGLISSVADYHRSEEHTSELQSLMRISYAVFCLKKKKTTITQIKESEKKYMPKNVSN